MPSPAVQRILFSQPVSPQAQSFLARTTNLGGVYRQAQIKLINGLVADGTWSLIDALWILATQDTTNAALNLVSGSFSLTPAGSPAFAAGQGYTGIEASTTVYIDTGINLSTYGGLFTTNSGHVSVWNNTNGTSAGGAMGVSSTTGANNTTIIYPKLTAGSKLFAEANFGTVGTGVTAATDPRGHIIANRTGSSASNIYIAGTLFQTTNAGSGALQNLNLTLLGENDATVGHRQGGAYQVCAASVGGQLTAAQALNFYNRMKIYMSTIGIPTF